MLEKVSEGSAGLLSILQNGDVVGCRVPLAASSICYDDRPSPKGLENYLRGKKKSPGGLLLTGLNSVFKSLLAWM